MRGIAIGELNPSRPSEKDSSNIDFGTSGHFVTDGGTIDTAINGDDEEIITRGSTHDIRFGAPYL